MVSEEVLPSERLKRLFLLAYFPCESPRAKTERKKSNACRSVQIHPDMFQKRKPGLQAQADNVQALWW